MYVLINKNHLPSLMLNKNLLQVDSMVCFQKKKKNPHILVASAIIQRMNGPSRHRACRQGEDQAGWSRLTSSRVHPPQPPQIPVHSPFQVPPHGSLGHL